MNKQQAFLMGVAAAKPKTEYVTRNVNVTEVRAPTDESVRLLKEMEEKAEAKVLETIRIEGNGFNCVIHVMMHDYGFQTELRAVYTMNGRQVVSKHTASQTVSRQDMVRALMDVVARDVAAEILRPAFQKLDLSLMRHRR